MLSEYGSQSALKNKPATCSSHRQDLSLSSIWQ